MRIAVNILSSYARFLTGVVSVFLLTPFTLGVVGVEQFGLWSLTLAVIGVLGLLDLGLSTTAVKLVAECAGTGDARARNEALSTLALVYSVLGLVCLILVIAAVPSAIRAFDLTAADADTFRRVMAIGGAALALAFPLSIFRSALIGAGRFDLVNGVETVTILLNALLVVLLLKNGWGLTGLAFAYGTVLVAGPLALAPVAYRVMKDFRIHPGLARLERLGEVAPLAIYFMLANIALLVSLRSDALLIKAFLPLSAVAAFAIAAKIGEYCYLLNKQFSNALMPLVSRSNGAGDQRAVQSVLVDGTRFLMMIATPLLGLLFVHAESVVYLWVGPELDAVVLPLRILLVAVFFSTLQLNAANVLGMSGGHRGVAWTMIGSAALNLLLSFLLIPRMGLAGAALSTLIAALVLEGGLMLFRACRRQGFGPLRILRELIPVLACAVPMAWLAHSLAARWPIESFVDLAVNALLALTCYTAAVSLVALRKHERRLASDWIVRTWCDWRPGRAPEGRQHG